jgi:hypothetical protein
MYRARMGKLPLEADRAFVSRGGIKVENALTAKGPNTITRSRRYAAPLV